MQKLIFLSDGSEYAKTCFMRSSILGYDPDVIYIDNENLGDLTPEDIFNQYPEGHIFIASNERHFSMRRMFFIKVASYKKVNLINLISPKSVFPETLKVGTNIFIGDDVCLGDQIIIGDGVIVEDGAVIMSNSIIGKGAYIGKRAVIGPNSIIGNGSLVGPNVCIDSIQIGSSCKVFNPIRYSKNIPSHTSYIENHSEPIIFYEGILA